MEYAPPIEEFCKKFALELSYFVLYRNNDEILTDSEALMRRKESVRIGLQCLSSWNIDDARPYTPRMYPLTLRCV